MTSAVNYFDGSWDVCEPDTAHSVKYTVQCVM